jgi:hypothetical protein
MRSPDTDPELSQWLRWASERDNTPMFVRTVAEAALMACMLDYPAKGVFQVKSRQGCAEG